LHRLAKRCKTIVANPIPLRKLAGAVGDCITGHEAIVLRLLRVQIRKVHMANGTMVVLAVKLPVIDGVPKGVPAQKFRKVNALRVELCAEGKPKPVDEPLSLDYCPSDAIELARFFHQPPSFALAVPEPESIKPCARAEYSAFSLPFGLKRSR
jgi:hypothetical protein